MAFAKECSKPSKSSISHAVKLFTFFMHAMMLCYLTASADYIIEPNDKDSSGQEALYVAEYEFQQLYARSQAEFSSVPPYSFTYHLIYSEEKTQKYGYIAFPDILLMSLLPGVTGGGLPVTGSQGDIILICD